MLLVISAGVCYSKVTKSRPKEFMTKLFVLSAILLTLSPVVQASETYFCTAEQNSSVIPTQVQIVIDGNQVTGKFNFNFDGTARTWASFGIDKNNDFNLQYSNVSSDKKEVVFSKDGYDHFTYDLVFSSQSAVLKQDMQLDCTSLVQSHVFMTCEKN